MESILAVPYLVDSALRYGGLALYAAVAFPLLLTVLAAKWR